MLEPWEIGDRGGRRRGRVFAQGRTGCRFPRCSVRACQVSCRTVSRNWVEGFTKGFSADFSAREKDLEVALQLSGGPCKRGGRHSQDGVPRRTSRRCGVEVTRKRDRSQAPRSRPNLMLNTEKFELLTSLANRESKIGCTARQRQHDAGTADQVQGRGVGTTP